MFIVFIMKCVRYIVAPMLTKTVTMTTTYVSCFCPHGMLASRWCVESLVSVASAHEHSSLEDELQGSSTVL